MPRGGGYADRPCFFIPFVYRCLNINRGRGTVAALVRLEPASSMLETIAILLVLMWLLGMVSSYTLGGYIHILLIVALVVVVLRLVRGKDPLK